MKVFVATLVTTQTQEVRVVVPDYYNHENVLQAICEKGSLSDGEFDHEVHGLTEETE